MCYISDSKIVTVHPRAGLISATETKKKMLCKTTPKKVEMFVSVTEIRGIWEKRRAVFSSWKKKENLAESY